MLYDLAVEKINNIYHLQAIIEQETGEVISLEDFINLKGNIFVSNLNVAFFDIIQFLKSKKYRNVFKVHKNGQYSFAYKNGECLNIKIRHEKSQLTITNFTKKFLRDFSDYETNKKLLDYSYANNRLASSLGVDAFNEWLQSTFKCKKQIININACRELFRQDYPIIKDDILERAKESTSGYQFAKQGYYNNIYHYDIKSSFPAQYINDTPTGKPREFNSFDEMPPSYFYIVKFTAIDIKLNPNKIDFLNINNKNVLTFVLTKHLFELFKINYSYYQLKIKRITAFKTRQGRFSSFLQKTVLDGKLNEFDKVIAKYNKGIANSLNGYFGKNTISIRTKFSNGKLIEKREETPPIYLPIYLFVTGKAKAEFIKTLQRIGLKNIIYANTDGFLSSEPIDIDWLNFGRSGLGAFSEKPKFKEIFIECVNGYAGIYEDGTIDNTISGMKTLSKLSVDEYMSKSYDYVVHEITSDGICERVVHR